MSILLIDDEPDILDMLTKHMTLAGLTCDTARSAEEALKAHAHRMYPVVLTDIMMPNMDGIELIRRIKALHPTCIIYVMTGNSTLPRMVECIEVGATDYFTKPFESVSDIVEILRDALARHARWMRAASMRRKT